MHKWWFSHFLIPHLPSFLFVVLAPLIWQGQLQKGDEDKGKVFIWLIWCKWEIQHSIYGRFQLSGLFPLGGTYGNSLDNSFDRHLSLVVHSVKWVMSPLGTLPAAPWMIVLQCVAPSSSRHKNWIEMILSDSLCKVSGQLQSTLPTPFLGLPTLHVLWLNSTNSLIRHSP